MYLADLYILDKTGVGHHLPAAEYRTDASIREIAHGVDRLREEYVGYSAALDEVRNQYGRIECIRRDDVQYAARAQRCEHQRMGGDVEGRVHCECAVLGHAALGDILLAQVFEYFRTYGDLLENGIRGKTEQHHHSIRTVVTDGVGGGNGIAQYHRYLGIGLKRPRLRGNYHRFGTGFVQAAAVVRNGVAGGQRNVLAPGLQGADGAYGEPSSPFRKYGHPVPGTGSGFHDLGRDRIGQCVEFPVRDLVAEDPHLVPVRICRQGFSVPTQDVGRSAG